jgi:hypothetical protein
MHNNTTYKHVLFIVCSNMTSFIDYINNAIIKLQIYFNSHMVPFCLLLKNYERYLLEILYATSVFHHPKHDIIVILEICLFLHRNLLFKIGKQQNYFNINL